MFKDIIRAAIQEQIRDEERRPLIISVMGQTGVGKTSLINALFHIDLPTDPVRPCTKRPQRVTYATPTGATLHFYDLPGIGEVATDEEYLASYREKLMASDIVLWAFHADSRSVSYDRASLLTILAGLEKETQAQLVNKITFVLTKADLLAPPAWTLAIVGPDQGIFVPAKQTERLLEEKALYVCEALLGDSSETLPTSLHRCIPCSARFRYNLDRLMVAILERLPDDAIGRFGPFFSQEMMSLIPLEDAKACCNLILFNHKTKSVVFDLRNIPL